MAGIGLELKRLQRGSSYVTVARVFGYSLALSVGPWLATIFAVGFVSLIGQRFLGLPDMVFFTSTVMYIFAGSLLATGPLFMVFSRYLADRSFLGHMDQRRALAMVQLILVPLSLVIGMMGARHFFPVELGNSWLYQVATAILFASLTGAWCSLAYLDFQKRYATSFFVFAGGCIVSVILAFILRHQGLDGLLSGFAGGLLLAFVGLLIASMRKPEGASEIEPFSPTFLFSYGKTFSSLAAIGFLYNLGTWIDKFLLWHITGHIVDGSRMRIFPPYDIATFLSYLIMMPAISYFLVMVETRFYYDYRDYLEHLERSSLRLVEEQRDELWKNLKRHMNNLFELELVVGVVGLFIGSFLLRRLGLDETTVNIFRVLIGAAFFQVLFWIHLILLLYFEFRLRALGMAVLFFVLNTGLTWLNATQAPWLGFGWGYLAAIAICTVASWLVLRNGIANLSRHIFFINSGTGR